MHSYRYYILNSPVISDNMFDKLCRYLLEVYDKYEHMHKHLITKEDLKCGTCLIKEYPQRVINASKYFDVHKFYIDHSKKLINMSYKRINS